MKKKKDWIWVSGRRNEAREGRISMNSWSKTKKTRSKSNILIELRVKRKKKWSKRKMNRYKRQKKWNKGN